MQSFECQFEGQGLLQWGWLWPILARKGGSHLYLLTDLSKSCQPNLELKQTDKN
jgi:hypothetical protein